MDRGFSRQTEAEVQELLEDVRPEDAQRELDAHGQNTQGQ